MPPTPAGRVRTCDLSDCNAATVPKREPKRACAALHSSVELSDGKEDDEDDDDEDDVDDDTISVAVITCCCEDGGVEASKRRCSENSAASEARCAAW